MAIVSSLVFLPRITSTSGICRTGLKKWMPQNRSGCFRPSASLRDRNRRGVRAEERIGAQLRLESRE